MTGDLTLSDDEWDALRSVPQGHTGVVGDALRQVLALRPSPVRPWTPGDWM